MIREAATLIMTIPMKSSSFPGNYGALMMRRTANASFMPNSSVFPGGAIASTDSQEKWLTKLTQKQINSTLPKVKNAKRPPMFQNKDDEIDRNVSLRISAIRETFEESGILILRKNNELIDESSLPNKSELKIWRKECEKDSSKFYEMCCELGLGLI
jgi:nucleoside diphosphate-linked moiety X motif protein 19